MRYLFPTVFASALLAGMLSFTAQSEKLVLLHTNDTHSQIEPTSKNQGGVVRRKALIDSVRGVEDNVLLIDAGDAVQGSVYFTMFGGDVEMEVMNRLGYDIQILGNHEFDNGVDALASQWRKLKAEKLATNYDFSDAPGLDSIFTTYIIKEYDGKKIGFIGINIDPTGMIADKNSRGVKYLDGLTAANSTAWHLKHNEKVDMVVAITHIGYSDEPGYVDTELVESSHDIDVIIGGHSHTVLNPSDPESKPWKIKNADGEYVLVAQTGNAGRYVGEITIDLDTRQADYKLLPVDKRYDDCADTAFVNMLKPYETMVAKEMAKKVGYAVKPFEREGSLVNWMADYVHALGRQISGKDVDLAIVNKGGVRADLDKGVVTKGEILQIFPFDNRAVVIELTGADLLEALNVMAERGGDGVSGNVRVSFNPESKKCLTATVDGMPIDPTRTYSIATIDYLANGGDYMVPFRKGKVVAQSEKVLYDDMLDSFETGSMKGKKMKPDTTIRMYPVKED